MLYAFRYARYRGYFAGVAGTTTVTHLGATRFADMKFRYPDIDSQKLIIDNLDKITKSILHSEEHHLHTTQILRPLISQTLGGFFIELQ